MTTIIIDYGMGNLRSVQKAFERIGEPAVISSQASRDCCGNASCAARCRGVSGCDCRAASA